MSLEDIKNKIIAEAEQKARDIRRKAQEEAEEILREGGKQAERIKKELMTRAQREAVIKKNKVISTARLQIRKDILKEKQDAIKEAFRLAAHKVLNLPGEEYQSFVTNSILKTPINNANEAKIICNDRDKGWITEAWIKEIASKLSASDGEIRLSLSPESRNIQGGVIISAEGIEFNYSLDMLLEFLRNNMEREVYSSLFKELDD